MVAAHEICGEVLRALPQAVESAQRACAAVAINAAHTLGDMRARQIGGRGLQCALIVRGFGLRVARCTEVVASFERERIRETATRDEEQEKSEDNGEGEEASHSKD